jgi:hypothetical protein
LYSTCIFCNNALGSNEVLESFPVGRRLAFDVASGRLWVVCRSCERWNLSPLEERWEIIDDCERLFRNTQTRVSTENIGLARLREGLELVRIGRPLRPEFAAWRYGDQFGRRRRKLWVRAAVGLLATGVVVSGAWAAGFATITLWQVGGQLAQPLIFGSNGKVVARVPHEKDRLKVRRTHLKDVHLLADGRDAFKIKVPVALGKTVTLAGEDAKVAAGMLLPHINRDGGNQKEVQGAVGILETTPDPGRYLSNLAYRTRDEIIGGTKRSAAILTFPTEVRLAMEMGMHEEAERRAMEGELKALEIAWQEANEVAAISDNLLVPTFIQETIDRIRSK